LSSAPKWRDYQVHSTFDPYAPPAEKGQREAKQQIMQGAYRADKKRFQQQLFAIAVPLGLATLAAGAFLRRPAIGTGLMFGGIFSICDGYFNYWSELADVLKFGSLLVAFGLLIFLGYRRLERKEVAK
jgi:hypothetical protein